MEAANLGRWGHVPPLPLDPPLEPQARWGPLSSLPLLIPFPPPLPYPLSPFSFIFHIPSSLPLLSCLPLPLPPPLPFPSYLSTSRGLTSLVQVLVGGLGSAVSSPSQSGRSPPAKWFAVHFELRRVLLQVIAIYTELFCETTCC